MREDAAAAGPAAAAAQGQPLPGAVRVRRGRIVFPARRPALLVVPLALLTEVAGVAFLLGGIPIGWAVCAAPVAALLTTGALFRPTLELCREGLVQRQYPFSSLTRWEAIDHVGITRAGNRTILAYRLADGAPAPRRQPAAALLRAAGRPYDGGYFADAIAGRPEDLLRTLEIFVRDPARRAALPAARR